MRTETAMSGKGAAGGMPKVTMPSMPMSYARTARYRRLDQARACSLLWVAAPAGYGKSTLLSGYLRARARPTAWYQCDDSDGDIASFFHFIAQARISLGAQLCDLPRFAPQYLAALPTFTRNFFRHWFATLPAGSTLVLDNWQDIPAEAPLPALLETIVNEVPAGVQLIVISRHAPDGSLARLLASERMDMLGVAELQLSKAELRAIARRQCGRARTLDEQSLDSLYELTQGWAAGVTLLLRPPWGGELPRCPQEVASHQGIFGYLATEAYADLPEPIREFLRSLVYLEHITVPLAERLSGNLQAAGILGELVQQNAFTAYRVSSNSYHLHPLFRELLHRQCADQCAAVRRAARLRTADALVEAGDLESALQLYRAAQAWPEAVCLLRQCAPALVRDARLETLLLQIQALPEQVACGDGWVLYWRGVCRNTLDVAQARGDFERAHELLREQGDLTGAMLAASAVLMHIAFSYVDFQQMLSWIVRLERYLDEDPVFPDRSVELQVRSAFMTVLSQALPTHPGLAERVASVSQLLMQETNLTMRAEAVSALMLFFSNFGQTAQYRELDHQLEALLADPRLPPLPRLNFLWLKAYKLHAAGETAQALALLAEARALARAEGLHTEDARLTLCELQTQHPDEAPGCALEQFSRLEPYTVCMPPVLRAHFLYVRAIFELGCGHLREALDFAEASVPLVRACHWPIGETIALLGLAEVYCAVGRLDAAAACVAECDRLLGAAEAPLVHFNIGLVRAEQLRLQGARAAYAAELKRVMALGRRQGYANAFHASSRLLDHLIPEAFALDIEPGYCRWVIAKRHLQPPAPQSLAWPWPVRISTFGGFKVEVEGRALQFEGKVQRKPIELLKWLTVRAEGMEAAAAMDAIWPELDGDAARNALDLALHRLRKMLACKQAVTSSNGLVALNPRRVWLDVTALAALGAPGNLQAAASAAEQVLKIYRGPYLAGEELSGGFAAARLQWRKRFARLVRRLGSALESTQQFGTAHQLYEHALDVEADDELQICLAGAERKRQAYALHGDA